MKAIYYKPIGLLLIFIANYTVASGLFSLSESRKLTLKAVLHDTRTESGYPADNFDGKCVCAVNANGQIVPQFNTPTNFLYSSTTSNDCALVEPHNLNPNDAYTFEMYQSANRYFEEQLNRLWKFNHAIEYLPNSIADSLLKFRPKSEAPILNFNIYEYVIKYNNRPDVHTGMMVHVVNYSYKEHFFQVINQGFPDQAAIVRTILMLQYLLDKAETTKRSNSFISEVLEPIKGGIESKVLLLDTNTYVKGLDAKSISDSYPYKYKLTSKAEIDNVIVNRIPGYAYVVSCPSLATGYDYRAYGDMKGNLGRTYNQIVIDTETGGTLSSSFVTWLKAVAEDYLPLTVKDFKMLVKRAKIFIKRQ